MKKKFIILSLSGLIALTGCSYSKFENENKKEEKVKTEDDSSLNKEEANILMNNIDRIKSKLNENRTLIINEEEKTFTIYITDKDTPNTPVGNEIYTLSKNIPRLTFTDGLIKESINIQKAKEIQEGYSKIKDTLIKDDKLKSEDFSITLKEYISQRLITYIVKEKQKEGYQVNYDSTTKDLIFNKPKDTKKPKN